MKSDPRRAPEQAVTLRKTASARALSVAIATRPAIFCELLSRVLTEQPGFNVVGQAHEEDRLAELLQRERPRILLLDYEALGPNAEGMISRLRHAAPSTRVLVLATRSGNETVTGVLRAGASGLIGKELDFVTLVRAIQAIAGGQVWANRTATAEALEELSAATHTASGTALTKREADIVMEVGRGLRNKEIAQRMNMSEKTVKTHLNNIFRKLHLDSRNALALYAWQRLHPKS